MTTFRITVPLNDKEIDALVQALEHHASVHYEWLFKEFADWPDRREESIGGILRTCDVVLRLQSMTVYTDPGPLVLSDDEVGIVQTAIENYTPVCEQRGTEECAACERPYSELPAVLAAILPRLEYGPHWEQTSGHIPGDPATGKPSTIWIK